jgi:hypothetical protein
MMIVVKDKAATEAAIAIMSEVADIFLYNISARKKS